jgi:hypothetical protein
MRWWLGATLASALILGGGAAGAAAPTPTPAQLLVRHAPILVLHPQERFAPAPVETFLADSDLVGSRYDNRNCSARDGFAALDCYDAADAAHGAAPVVYGTWFRAPDGRVALQYWLFYAYNLWSPVVPQSPDFWQAHEGDWEAVTVLLDRRGRPQTLGVSRHCSGGRRAWGRAERRGPRPVVYVALGSHSNDFGPGRGTLDPRCWPREAIAIFRAYGRPLYDYTGRGAVVAPAVVRVTARAPSWIAFRGRCGETQYVHFPNNDPIAFGAGPRGPAFHDLWRRPFAVPGRWRAD